MNITYYLRSRCCSLTSEKSINCIFLITPLFKLSGELLRSLRLPDVVRDFYIRVVPREVGGGVRGEGEEVGEGGD